MTVTYVAYNLHAAGSVRNVDVQYGVYTHYREVQYSMYTPG